jgi:hypothetical protein
MVAKVLRSMMSPDMPDFARYPDKQQKLYQKFFEHQYAFPDCICVEKQRRLKN